MRNTTTVSECCSGPIQWGRCGVCKEAVESVEICNECSEELTNCSCEERCVDCNTWGTGACFTCSYALKN